MHTHTQRYSEQEEITIKMLSARWCVTQGCHVLFFVVFITDHDLCCEGTVLLSVYLPPQECMHQKQMPNVAAR